MLLLELFQSIAHTINFVVKKTKHIECYMHVTG